MGKLFDLTGKQIGRLKIIGRVYPAKNPIVWRCKCICGRYTNSTTADLNKPNKKVPKSCGCAKKEYAKVLASNLRSIDITGKRFGRWKVIRFSGTRRNSHKIWTCKCDCGTIRGVATSSLTQNLSTSCGCYQREIAPLLALHMSKNRRLNSVDDMSVKTITRALRYERQKQATPDWVDKKQLKKIYAECPHGHHVDHIHPLVHENFCGLHVPWNLQYLPARDNLVKGNRLDLSLCSS